MTALDAFCFGVLRMGSLWPTEIARAFEWLCPEAFAQIYSIPARPDRPSDEVLEAMVDAVAAASSGLGLPPMFVDHAGTWVARITQELEGDAHASMH